MNIKDDRIVQVYAGAMWQAEMVKSLLEAAGINSFLRNALINSYAFDPISAEGVQVMISEADYPLAQTIVDEYESTQHE